jgi:hypothetical protein
MRRWSCKPFTPFSSKLAFFNFTIQSKIRCFNLTTDDLIELESTIDPHCICPHCLRRSRGKHLDNCHPIFNRPIFGKLNRLIVQVIPGSPASEKLICVRMAKASLDCKGYAKLGLHKGSWIWNRQPIRCFILTDNEEITSYIAMGRGKNMVEPDQGEKDVVVDMFTLKDKRGKGNMTFLLLNALKSMNLRFDTVLFEHPLCEAEGNFLDSVSEQTGLRYKIC